MSLVVVHLPPGTRARSLRTGLVFLAILLVNYTLGRPSPVDIAFASALALTIFCHQSLTASSLIYIACAIIWFFGMYSSSTPFMHEDGVEYQLVKVGYAITISFTACLTAVHWGPSQLRLFFKVWIFSACIAASLGAFGFATGEETFLWDGRAKGLLDDPNMYGAFLLPGMIACVYFLFTERRRVVYSLALTWLMLGLLLSFSRVAIAAFFVLGPALAIILNRARPMKVIVSMLAMAIVVTLVGAAALIVLDDFGAKFTDRLAFAKDYDSGEYGRLNRYFIAIDLILSNPQGLGLLQFVKTYPEPIHNILLSSFMNFGWGAGLAWVTVMVFAVVLALRNFKRTGDSIFLMVLLGWLGIITCAMLHEAERWRHMWLLTGLIWGLNIRNWALLPAYENLQQATREPRPPLLQPSYAASSNLR